MDDCVLSSAKVARKFIFNFLSSLFKIPFVAQINLEEILNKESVLYCMDEDNANANDLSKWKVVYTGSFEMIPGSVTISYIVYLDKPDVMHVSIDDVILIIKKESFDNDPEKVFNQMTSFIGNQL